MRKSYIYYEEGTGSIRSITPVQTNEHPNCVYTQVDFDIALKFLTGAWDPAAWFVDSISTQEEGTLSQIQFDLLPGGNGHLEVIPRDTSNSKMTAAIFVNIYTRTKMFEVSIPTMRPDLDLDRLKVKHMIFYLTKRNDPSVVLEEISIPIKELFKEGNVKVEFKADVRDFTVYTNKLFRFYQLKVRNNMHVSRINNGRINKLIAYQNIEDITSNIDGINVVHNINKNMLEIRLLDILSDIANDVPSSQELQLYLTKPNDPTILIDMISVSVDLLMTGKVIYVPLIGVTDDFGVASYPYTNTLTFMRK